MTKIEDFRIQVKIHLKPQAQISETYFSISFWYNYCVFPYSPSNGRCWILALPRAPAPSAALTPLRSAPLPGRRGVPDSAGLSGCRWIKGSWRQEIWGGGWWEGEGCKDVGKRGGEGGRWFYEKHYLNLFNMISPTKVWWFLISYNDCIMGFLWR